MTLIRAVCPCGWPFDPDTAYDNGTGNPPAKWTRKTPREYCSPKCKQKYGEKAKLAEKKKQKLRDLLEACEHKGQMTLFRRGRY